MKRSITKIRDLTLDMGNFNIIALFVDPPVYTKNKGYRCVIADDTGAITLNLSFKQVKGIKSENYYLISGCFTIENNGYLEIKSWKALDPLALS